MPVSPRPPKILSSRIPAFLLLVALAVGGGCCYLLLSQSSVSWVSALLPSSAYSTNSTVPRAAAVPTSSPAAVPVPTTPPAATLPVTPRATAEVPATPPPLATVPAVPRTAADVPAASPASATVPVTPPPVADVLATPPAVAPLPVASRAATEVPVTPPVIATLSVAPGAAADVPAASPAAATLPVAPRAATDSAPTSPPTETDLHLSFSDDADEAALPASAPPEERQAMEAVSRVQAPESALPPVSATPAASVPERAAAPSAPAVASLAPERAAASPAPAVAALAPERAAASPAPAVASLTPERAAASPAPSVAALVPERAAASPASAVAALAPERAAASPASAVAALAPERAAASSAPSVSAPVSGRAASPVPEAYAEAAGTRNPPPSSLRYAAPPAPRDTPALIPPSRPAEAAPRLSASARPSPAPRTPAAPPQAPRTPAAPPRAVRPAVLPEDAALFPRGADSLPEEDRLVAEGNLSELQRLPAAPGSGERAAAPMLSPLRDSRVSPVLVERLAIALAENYRPAGTQARTQSATTATLKWLNLRFGSLREFTLNRENLSRVRPRLLASLYMPSMIRDLYDLHGDRFFSTLESTGQAQRRGPEQAPLTNAQMAEMFSLYARMARDLSNCVQAYRNTPDIRSRVAAYVAADATLTAREWVDSSLNQGSATPAQQEAANRREEQRDNLAEILRRGGNANGLDADSLVYAARWLYRRGDGKGDSMAALCAVLDAAAGRLTGLEQRYRNRPADSPARDFRP